MKADAVFEGGGVKGIALAGAVTALEEAGYQWNHLAGTSAGAIAAALLAAGYTGKELSEILMKVNYVKLLKGCNGDMFLITMIAKLLMYKGIYSTNNIETWIGKLLKAKGKEKFKDIIEKGEGKLKIIATDVTNRRMLILPDDLALFGIDPLEFSIAKAVSMSIAIPFFFTPAKIIKNNQVNLMVDGGLVSNFPVWIFDVQGKPRWPTFGFRLWENSKSRHAMGKKDIISYALDVMGAMLDKNEEIYLKDKDQVRTVNIPTLGIGTLQFDISKEQARKLYEAGYITAKKFLQQWDFEDYIKRYRR
ncbi:patatin-like phospholipase family protein [Clostridium thermarum]|uniref:patatin-like phospholipase family protein n=1 Tax=Clostridium thermarum TaxID=1716543 RepID=UPI0013D0D986|nr:patatin-like phospholipase family protein [Clostridium thermarum]